MENKKFVQLIIWIFVHEMMGKSVYLIDVNEEQKLQKFPTCFARLLVYTIICL